MATCFELLRVGARRRGRRLVEQEWRRIRRARGCPAVEIALASGFAVGIGLGGEALPEVGAPGVEVVDPGLDGELPGAELVDGEAGGPEVVGERGHGDGAPAPFAGVAVEQACGDMVVAVGEDGGGDDDRRR